MEQTLSCLSCLEFLGKDIVNAFETTGSKHKTFGSRFKGDRVFDVNNTFLYFSKIGFRQREASRQ